MNKKAIIFDFFGVICPNINYFLVNKYLGKNFDYQTISKQIDLGQFSQQQFIQLIAEKSNTPLQDVLTNMNNQILINDQVINLIKILKTKYKIGLLSDADANFLRKILSDHNLTDYFNQIAISSETGFTKPDERAFKFILKALDVEAEQSIFIDDNPINVAAAQKLGIAGILFRNINDLQFLNDNIE